MTVLEPFTATTVEALTFEGLYRELHQPLARFVLNSVRNPEDAEDICQDVWAKVDARLHELREPAAARTWVYRIARHAIIDAVRRRQRRPVSGPLTIEPPGPAADDPAVAALSKEQVALAWQTLAMLPGRQRMALYLKEVEVRRYSDIAEVLGCSESAVETLLFRARRNFLERFNGVADNRAQRCEHAGAAMAVLLDGEGDVVLRRGVEAHLSECHSCAEALAEAREMSRLRGGLLLPSLVLSPDVAAGCGLTALVSTTLEALRAAGAKLVAAFVGGKTAVAAGTVATTTMAALALAPIAPADTASQQVTTPQPLEVTSAPLPDRPGTYVEGDALTDAVRPASASPWNVVAPEANASAAVQALVVPVARVADAVPAVSLSVDAAPTVLLEDVAAEFVASVTDLPEPEVLLDEASIAELDTLDTSAPLSAQNLLPVD